MKIIGLTGGIGSGKTTVAQLFEILGIAVFNSDIEARRILAEDSEVIGAVTELIGPNAYINGAPDRPFIASQVFDAPEKLHQLNAIIHPAVARSMDSWRKKLPQAPYCIKEAAILFESGAASQCDAVVCVSAPEQMRVERVIKREGISEEQVRGRMKNQWPGQKVEEASDYVIINDGSVSIIQQVLVIHEQLAKL